METSPTIPPFEFRELDNLTGYTRVEVVGDLMQLRCRPRYVERGRFMYYSKPESPSDSTKQVDLYANALPNT